LFFVLLKVRGGGSGIWGLEVVGHIAENEFVGGGDLV
jgi:hypothetical protein